MIGKIIAILILLGVAYYLRHSFRLNKYQSLSLLVLLVLPFNITASITHFNISELLLTKLHVDMTVAGIPVNYLTPYMSILDITILLVLLSAILDKTITKRTKVLAILLATPFILITIFHSPTLISLIQLGRYITYGISLTYLSLNLIKGHKQIIEDGNLKTANQTQQTIKIALWIILTTAVLEIIIGITQIILGQSIGVYFIGESLINTTLGNVCKTIIDGTIYLRGYGTFPHPNIYASYIIFMSFLSIFLQTYIESNDIFSTLSHNVSRITRIILIINAIAIVLTLSKTQIALYAVLALLYIAREKPALTKRYLLIPTLLIPTAIIYKTASTLNSSISERLAMITVALETIKYTFPRGIGIGMFVKTYEQMRILSNGLYLIQPVHNIYLLITAELGLAGLVIAIAILALQVVSVYYARKSNEVLTITAVLQILIIGNLDHLFLTQPQGILIFFTYIFFEIFTLAYIKQRGEYILSSLQTTNYQEGL